MTQEIKDVFEKYGYEDVEISVNAEVETTETGDEWDKKEFIGKKTMTIKYHDYS